MKEKKKEEMKKRKERVEMKKRKEEEQRKKAEEPAINQEQRAKESAEKEAQRATTTKLGRIGWSVNDEGGFARNVQMTVSQTVTKRASLFYISESPVNFCHFFSL